MLPIANILLTATTFLAADVRNGDSGNFGDFVREARLPRA